MQEIKPAMSDKIAFQFLQFVASKIIKESFKFKKKKSWEYRDADIVYHYTSFDSFYKIIKTESLIASNALYLNDPEEFQGSTSAFKVSLEDLLKNKRISRFSKTVIEAILLNIQKITVSENYVTCFSAAKDLLSQWVAYGDRGNGIAIGFKVDELDSCSQHLADGAWVSYDIFKMMSSAEKVNLEFIKQYNHLVNSVKFESEEQKIDVAVELYLTHFLPNFLSHFKYGNFSEEKEYRLALRETKNNPIPLDIEFMPKDRSLIVPFTKFVLGAKFNLSKRDSFIDDGTPPQLIEDWKNTRLPIQEIILGPCVDKKFTEPGLQMFLNRHGYGNIKITKSNIALRNL